MKIGGVVVKQSGKRVITLLLVFFTVINAFGQNDPVREGIQKLATTMRYISMAYVDTVNQSELVEEAIEEMLRTLDPHSVYISKEDVMAANEPLEGNFEGVGIQFQIYKDTIMVVSPITDGPSERLGIMPGDKIVTIDGEEATGKEIDIKYVRDHLRGPKGSKVEVQIFRRGYEKLLDFTIVRDKIPIYSIDAHYMANETIGYIKLNRFAQTTMTEFHEAIDNLDKQGMKDLILDLRNNTGGFLQTAIALADEFLEDDRLIVYTKGHSSPLRNAYATSRGDVEKGRLIVLINEGSASASEIVAGAVQDWDRGIVMGRRSFGKGLVQQPFELPDHSVIRLTTARYYTPSGRCIQKPYTDGADDYFKDIAERLKHGEFVHPDSIQFPDSLKYSTQAGRAVYGGGGIMPDVFIPWDSTWISDYYMNLRRKLLFNQFVTGYMEQHREEVVKKYKHLDAFIQKFDTDESFMKDFFDFAQEEGVDFVEADYQSSGKVIRSVLKALIARNLFDVNAYFRVINQVDDGYIRAINELENGQLFEKLVLQDS